MQKLNFKCIICWLCIGLISVFAIAAVAAEKTDEKTDEKKVQEAAPPAEATVSALVTIVHSIKDLRSQLDAKKERLSAATGREQAAKIEAEVKVLSAKLASFEKDFEKIATGVDLEAFGKKAIEVFDWKKEIQNILGPVFQQLRGMTERPRQIEKLRMELAHYENRLEPVQKAVDSIKKLRRHTEGDQFKKQLETTLQDEQIEVLRNKFIQTLKKQEEKKIKAASKESYKKELAQALKPKMSKADQANLTAQLKKKTEEKLVADLGQIVATDRLNPQDMAGFNKHLAKELARQSWQQTLAKRTKQELGTLKEALAALGTHWENEQQQLSSQKVVTKYQLEEKLKQKTSFLGTIQNVLRVFFKSRGKNLLFALLAFFAVLLLFRLSPRFLYRFGILRHRKERSFYSRLWTILYTALTFGGATSAFLLVLYIFGDWVLLTISAIFFLGLAWTAQKGLPHFWEQIKLLLNLSTVREKERVEYKGIAWRVVSLNIYSHLENPDLSNGQIRLPVKDLVDLRSRPYRRSEPWFPTRVDDWVILSDGSFGKVLSQSPELVQIVLRGGARRTYVTQNYLDLSPTNLSTDFRIKVAFGIDYGHQSVSTEEIPAKMQEMLVEQLTEKGYADDIANIAVEFKEAMDSSLALEILADFKGQAASNHNRLQRLMNRIAVDACNKFRWVIPFPQLTVHSGASS
jgi:hypothetical protein